MYGGPMDSHKSVSPSALRKGHVYCVWSFARCAERWFKEEIARNSKSQGPESVSRRRQPSRAAKDKFRTGDYTLPTTMLDPAITTALTSSIVYANSIQCSGNSNEEGKKSSDVALMHFRTRFLGVFQQLDAKQWLGHIDRPQSSCTPPTEHIALL
ncbi:hypothetical protein F5883DRAFT_207965 [Diaporthe sp. PMI_573]|nr:hypothetical protein F5883DRAFT_207965 [Diaporthaceae sp. PMI_573]